MRIEFDNKLVRNTVDFNSKNQKEDGKIKKITDGNDIYANETQDKKDILNGKYLNSSETGDSNSNGKDSGKNLLTSEECTSCESRRYKDVSNDSTVSFQSPTKVSPEVAKSAIRAHEQQHVRHEQAKAKREGNEIMSQSVSYKHAVCPECGKPYTAGGVTRTVVKEYLGNKHDLHMSKNPNTKSQLKINT